MATKKKATIGDETGQKPAPRMDAYEKALDDFGAALEAMNSGDYATARERFEKVVADHSEESALAERARAYGRHCGRKLAPPPPEPETADQFFYQAVLHSNNGEVEEALRLLDRGLMLEPESPRFLYARASAAAIQGDAESAVRDLRRAIAADPQVRFQAGNDPDFESIREEPAFIDIIEPTPAGA